MNRITVLTVAGVLALSCAAFAGEESLNRVDFIGRRFLLRNHVIQAKDHQGVGVFKDALVDGQSLARLIDPLVDGDRLVRRFSDKPLELQR